MRERPVRRVTVFVIRRVMRRTQCLLFRAADGALRPLEAEVAAHERDADAAALLLEGLDATRLYAMGGCALDPDGASTCGFVAMLPFESAAHTPEDMCWSPLREAAGAMASVDRARLAEEVHRRFVRRPPDEALRIW